METGAVILSGGMARRMGGVDKGLVVLAGRPMVEHVLLTVRPLVSRVVINANRHFPRYERFGVPVVADALADHQGPLAGLAAGIDALETDLVLMCPCDSPFLQAALCQTLLQSCRQGDCDLAVAHDGDRLQPVFLAARRQVRDSLHSFLASGQRKIDQWFEQLRVQQVAATCWKRSFRNINTEADRAQAEAEFSR